LDISVTFKFISCQHTAKNIHALLNYLEIKGENHREGVKT